MEMNLCAEGWRLITNLFEAMAQPNVLSALGVKNVRSFECAQLCFTI